MQFYILLEFCETRSVENRRQRQSQSHFSFQKFFLYHLYQILLIVDMNSCRYCAIYRILPFCSQEVNEAVRLDKEFCTCHSYLSVSHILTQVIGNSITSCCLNYVQGAVRDGRDSSALRQLLEGKRVCRKQERDVRAGTGTKKGRVKVWIPQLEVLSLLVTDPHPLPCRSVRIISCQKQNFPHTYTWGLPSFSWKNTRGSYFQSIYTTRGLIINRSCFPNVSFSLLHLTALQLSVAAFLSASVSLSNAACIITLHISSTLSRKPCAPIILSLGSAPFSIAVPFSESYQILLCLE